ncbi:MAG TPA: SRPBCC domain-containing protein [Polyangiaceae bacterium]|nr:SRPBCC domain-containing protein [Polyangiaceae bacterium]
MRFERHYPHSREALWLALTGRRALEQAWLEADFEPQAGRRFTLRDLPRGPWGGLVRGEVLEAERPAVLRYTWEAGAKGEASTVTWRLFEEGRGARVVFEHEGFRGVRGRLSSLRLCVAWRAYLLRDLPAAADLFDRRGPDAAFPSPPRHVRVGHLVPLG